jgi:hypothetical protein
LEAALDGRPRLVLCSGEPGIGKTRLAEELMGLARPRGVQGAWGRGLDSTGTPPYWPWRQVLRAIQDKVDLARIAQAHRLAVDLAPLAPEVFAAPEGAVENMGHPRIGSGSSTQSQGCCGR